MQCWSCGFENIPGLRACARCASALSLEGINVEPPRSSLLHLATRMGRASNRVKSAFPYCARFIDWITRPFPKLASFLMGLRPWRIVLWAFIPGLAQIKTRRLRSGWAILSIWLVLLLLTIASIGTEWTWYLVSALVLTHAVSVAALLAEHLAFEGLLIRALFGICLFFTLSYFLYQPIAWFLGRFYQPLVMPRQSGAIFSAGDGIICQGPWRRPQHFARGDLVVYVVRSYQRAGFYVPEGLGLDRVVGAPGDHIQIQDGRVLVNGAEPQNAARPLGPVPARFADLDVQLEADQYLIVPSNFGWGHYDIPQQQRWPWDLARQLTVIPYEDVVGRAILRVHPLLRFGRIK